MSSNQPESCGSSSQNKRSGKRKQWSNEKMEQAIKAVDGGMSITMASSTFSVPRKTLDDRIKGKVVHGTNPGPCTALSYEEEKSLTEYLVYMANSGFPLTRTMVRAFTWEIAKRSNTDSRFNPNFGPGEHWWRLYKKRHPELTLRKVDMLQRSRAEALNVYLPAMLILNKI